MVPRLSLFLIVTALFLMVAAPTLSQDSVRLESRVAAKVAGEAVITNEYEEYYSG